MLKCTFRYLGGLKTTAHTCTFWLTISAINVCGDAIRNWMKKYCPEYEVLNCDKPQILPYDSEYTLVDENGDEIAGH